MSLQSKAALKSSLANGQVITQTKLENLIDTLVAEGGDTGALTAAIKVGATASATNNGSVAIGDSAIASNVGAVQFSSGTNDVAYSLRVKGSPRLCGDGAPSTISNGDMWITSGNVYIQSNGSSVNISSVQLSNTWHYWGSEDVDDSWRIGLSGSNLVVQVRVSGNWTDAAVFTKPS